LITFQRRHGFAANGFIDTRTVTALRLNGKISQNHIRGGGRETTGRGNGREAIDNRKGGMQRGESNARNAPPRQERSTNGQGGNEQPKAAQGRNERKGMNEPKTGQGNNEPKSGPKAMNEPMNQPKGGQNAQPRAERAPAQRSTTGQGSRENKMNRPEPSRSNQNKY